MNRATCIGSLACLSLALGLCAHAQCLAQIPGRSSADSDRITVTDLPRLATIGDPLTIGPFSMPNSSAGILSPDGRMALVLVRAGNLETHTNDAQLLLFDATDWSRPPRVVAQISSSTNYQPMAFVRWLSDSQHVTFAATDHDLLPEIYRIDIRTGERTQLTRSATPLSWYDISGDGSVLLTSNELPLMPPKSREDCRDQGCRVTGRNFLAFDRGVQQGSPRVTVYDTATGTSRALADPEDTDSAIRDCDEFEGGISTDGRYALRSCSVRDQPQWWHEYVGDPRLRWALDRGIGDALQTLVLVDLQENESHRISDAPYYSLTVPPIWIDHGRRAILSGVVESLADVVGPERVLRAARQFVLLFDPSTRHTERIGILDTEIAAVVSSKWHERTQTLILESQDRDRRSLPSAAYRRHGKTWVRLSGDEIVRTLASKGRRTRGTIWIEQSLNDPPVLYARVPNSSSDVRLFDPNPWLKSKKLGHVQEITWTTPDGRSWAGGLYYPPDYQPGRRYPLLLQTHGFDSKRFSLSGKGRNVPGRAIAARGVLVLQVQENERDIYGLPLWWPAMQAGYESAIDKLDALQLVDRQKVGIAGWSFTGVTAGYALTHSSYDFAAASLVATSDFGWASYMLAGAPNELERIFGAAPFGDGMNEWIERSPTFNLERIRAPVLLWAEGSALTLWDWYTGLKRLEKPHEFWLAPDMAHDAFRIDHQIALNQLLVDWFAFWLKDEEDAAVTKKEQYARWRELRERQQSVKAGQHTTEAGTE